MKQSTQNFHTAAGKNIRGSIMLILCSMIWGTAFVAQSVGMNYIGPLTFNTIRCFVGGIALLPLALLQPKLTGKSILPPHREGKLALLRGGISCGVILFVASTLQQIGIKDTTPGKAGFITALYIVLVPLFGLVAGKRVGGLGWLGVILATAGLYLLCVTESLSFARMDLCLLAAAVCFTFHIIVVDIFSPQCNGIQMSCIQFLVAGVIGTPLMFFFETPDFSAIWSCRLPILYAGVMSCGVAYTLQILGQKYINPTLAAILMSLESVFAVLSDWIILGNTMSMREIVGCVLMFTAIILAQLPADLLVRLRHRLTRQKMH